MKKKNYNLNPKGKWRSKNREVKNKIGKVKNKNEIAQWPLWASVVKATTPLIETLYSFWKYSVTNINEGVSNDKKPKPKAT